MAIRIPNTSDCYFYLHTILIAMEGSTYWHTAYLKSRSFMLLIKQETVDSISIHYTLVIAVVTEELYGIYVATIYIPPKPIDS